MLRNPEDVLRWAEASPTREVCGIVIGGLAVQVPNSSDNPDSFQMTREHLLAVPGIEDGIEGVWHSHPDRYPYPSDGDWANHPEGLDLYIVSGGAVRQFEKEEETLFSGGSETPVHSVPIVRVVWSS